MKGTIAGIDCMTGQILTMDTTDPNVIDYVEQIVKGSAEVIDGFDRFMPPWLRGYQKCIAFRNNAGKERGLKVNAIANAHWLAALKGKPPHDVLVGNIAIVYGDDEFLEGV